jgi:alkylhydroperoxidase/carboxymuconolactone decarboxylase family protein
MTETTYYAPKDLAKFGEVGKFAPELMAKFFEYYNAATGTDGALTRREKALIALAVSHAKQCPYCIDAYTTACLETGSNPEQMSEAIHVAAAMEAGMALVHGVQMQNALRAKGAL